MEFALLRTLPGFLWNYHRSNYLYDERIVQNSELLHYNFQVQLYGQFRADIRSFWTITKLKLTNVQVLSTIQIGLALALFTVGRPKPDEYVNHYVLGLFTGSVAASMGLLFLSLWFSIQCMLASHADNFHLLLRETRLPIPTTGLLNTVVARADKFEAANKNKPYRRLPFVEKLKVERRGSVVHDASSTLHQMLFDAQKAPRFACTGNASNLKHVQAFRTLQAYWINYDAYSRICMSIGSLAFFRTMAYFSTFAVTRHSSIQCGSGCALIMIVTAVVIIYIDLQSTSFKTLLTAALFSFSPYIALGLSVAESALGGQNQFKANIIMNIAGACAFLAEAAWYMWVWFLCTPDESGLPVRYRTAVMFLNLLDNEGVGAPASRSQESPVTTECARRAERAAADGIESPAASVLGVEEKCVETELADREDSESKELPKQLSARSQENSSSHSRPQSKAGQHAASVGFVNQKAPAAPSTNYCATPDERAEHYERLTSRLALLQKTIKYLPTKCREDAAPLIKRAARVCQDLTSVPGDGWVGIEADLDGYGSTSRYYVSSSAGVSWVAPAQYVMIQQIFTDIIADLDVVEKIRTPDARGFEGIHRAHETADYPWGQEFQHGVLRSRYGDSEDIEATAKRINGTFYHWKLLRINLAIVIAAHLMYAVMSFSFFTTKHAAEYQDMLMGNMVPIRLLQPSRRRLPEFLSPDKQQVRLRSDMFQWPYVPRDLRCQNGSIWHSNGLIAYRDRARTALFETERFGRVLLSDTVGFALDDNGDAIRYERSDPKTAWRRLAKVPTRSPAVHLDVVAPWTLVVATRDAVLRVRNDTISIVWHNRGKPWERACYDLGWYYLLGIEGNQWEITSIRL